MNEVKFETKGGQLTVIRTFNAPIELVWKTWTDAELLDRWWAPLPWKSKTKQMDFREQGTRLYAMFGPKGEEHWGLTTYMFINKPSDFSGKDAFCNAEGVVHEELHIAEFKNIFQEESNSTVVTVVTRYASENHLKQVIQMGMKEGLTMAYSNLDKLITHLKQRI